MIRYDDVRDVAAVQRADRLVGLATLPSDKSIAHRAALFAALADGASTVHNYPGSADPQSTVAALRQLGVRIDVEDSRLQIDGKGLEGLSRASEPVDCGNSGTTMRLLAGILAAQRFDSTLIGDASLTVRPMDRVAMPLREMGARLSLTNGHAPIEIAATAGLHGISYKLPMASAQVKSCVLLAGLFASGTTTVIEPVPSRDHTERMLGLSILSIDGEPRISVTKGHRIPAQEWFIPRDFSAAAFFLVAGALVPGSDVRMERVGLNPSRNALLRVLQIMGADISISNETVQGGEPVGDVRVRSSELEGVTVSGDLIPNLIDEIPVLAVAGALAGGRMEIRNAAELRVKETDRLRATAENLHRMGARVRELEDGLVIEGGNRLHGAYLESFGDHRIAMAFGVAGLAATGETTIGGASCAAVSFPDFWDALRSLSEAPTDVS